MKIIGRLTIYNPSYIIPSLRRQVIQLLTELKTSNDNNNEAESAFMLGLIIQSCSRLIRPYITPLLDALINKMDNTNNHVAGTIITTLGHLCIIAETDIIDQVDVIMPKLLSAIQDQSSSFRRRAALKTLGTMAGSAGYVIDPYIEYPFLLDLILSILNSTPIQWSVRLEVLRTLGILGSLDPYQHYINQLVLTGRTEREDGQRSNTAIVQSNAPLSRNEDRGTTTDISGGILIIAPRTAEYNPSITIKALMRIFKDSSLSMHHPNIIQAVMFIFRSMGLNCIPYLPQIIPVFLHIMNDCDHLLRESLFTHLGLLITIIKQHIRTYLSEIFYFGL